MSPALSVTNFSYGLGLQGLQAHNDSTLRGCREYTSKPIFLIEILGVVLYGGKVGISSFLHTVCYVFLKTSAMYNKQFRYG